MAEMRYLGVDYGDRRVGLATADAEMGIAVPRGVIVRENDARALRDIGAVIAEEKIEQVVVGLPLGHDGAETDASRVVRAFAERLREQIAIPIEFANEIFTSRMAAHPGVQKEQIDAASAAIILQSYLDKKIESGK